MERILQTSEDVSRRVASIETRSATFVASTRYATSTLRAPLENDDASTITPKANADEKSELHIHAIEEQSLPSGSSQTFRHFDPNLESEFYASRVYSRTTHRHSISSLLSNQDSVAGLSFLSGISLAQISSISVISLPIVCHELWNSQHYMGLKDLPISFNSDAVKPTSLISINESDAPGVESKGSGNRSILGLESIVGLNGNLVKEMLTSRPRARFLAEAIHSARNDWIWEEENKEAKACTKTLLLGECI